MDPPAINSGVGFGSASVLSGPAAGPSAVSPTTSVAGSATGATGPNGAPIKRRSPIACRRCRRMRSKCIHEKATPPCKSCAEAGIPADDCIFPVRGQPDSDRDYRHPRTRAEKASKQASKPRRADGTISRDSVAASTASVDDWDNLPPLGDLIDGVNRFTRHYFQLGFIPKVAFPERLQKDHLSVNLFLVLSILSISARLSPSLRATYGTGVKAAEFFMERASEIAIGEIYQEPSLERCQAFYLLSIAQQGSGLRNASYINMGISMRMAALMQLHREETYQMQNPTPELITRAESARRTLWMLHSQDSLHSGPLSPVSLSAADITALLPCNEEDFANGREPRSRAALEGTPPATDNPSLIRDPNRSLFATLMQIHHYWGIVGRRAVSYSRSSRPWELTSEFSQMAQRLHDWEACLPHEHTWSRFLLMGYKAEGQDLAYLCVTMMTRLCNIVLRRPYLVDIIKPDQKDPHRQPFFSKLAADLFRNVRDLYEQVDAQFSDRTPDESVGAQIAAFCVYSCGLFSTYICKYPHLCQDPALAREGPVMLQRTIAILMECKQVWPLAARWAEALEKSSRDPQSATLTAEGSMADGKDPVPRAIRQIPDAVVLPRPVLKLEHQHSAPTSTMPSPQIGYNGHNGRLSSLSSPVNANFTPPQLQHQFQPLSQQHQLHQPSPQPISHLQQQQQHHHQPQQQQQQQQQHQLNQYQQQPPLQQHQAQQQGQQQQQQQHQPQLHQASPHLQQPQQRIPQDAAQYQQQQVAAVAAAPSHMYIPQQPPPPQLPQLTRQPVDGLGMLIEAFDSPQQPAPYTMGGAYMPQLGPGNDGFEGELQFYIDGNQGWMPPGGWMDTM